MRNDSLETALDQYITSEMRQQHIPGLSVGLYRNGKLCLAKGYGQANLEWETPVSETTVFQIGSLTKQFTAAAVLLLHEEGRINLDAPMVEYLDHLSTDWQRITLRQMLTHTSGLPDVTELPGFLYGKDYTREELAVFVAGHSLRFEPGTGWYYSNTGYAFLGWIIEEASGKSYRDFLTERIFVPAGMTLTRTIIPEEIVPQRAAGYCWKGYQCNGDPARPRVIAGAGGLLSTAVDLAAWDAALCGEAILSDALKELMWTPATLTDGSFACTNETCGDYYGFGWFVGEHMGRRAVAHTGMTDAGFSSEILRFLDDRRTLIVLTNCEPVEQDRIIKEMAHLWFEMEP